MTKLHLRIVSLLLLPGFTADPVLSSGYRAPSQTRRSELGTRNSHFASQALALRMLNTGGTSPLDPTAEKISEAEAAALKRLQEIHSAEELGELYRLSPLRANEIFRLIGNLGTEMTILSLRRALAPNGYTQTKVYKMLLAGPRSTAPKAAPKVVEGNSEEQEELRTLLRAEVALANEYGITQDDLSLIAKLKIKKQISHWLNRQRISRDELTQVQTALKAHIEKEKPEKTTIEKITRLRAATTIAAKEEERQRQIALARAEADIDVTDFLPLFWENPPKPAVGKDFIVGLYFWALSKKNALITKGCYSPRMELLDRVLVINENVIAPGDPVPRSGRALIRRISPSPADDSGILRSLAWIVSVFLLSSSRGWTRVMSDSNAGPSANLSLNLPAVMAIGSTAALAAVLWMWWQHLGKWDFFPQTAGDGGTFWPQAAWNKPILTESQNPLSGGGKIISDLSQNIQNLREAESYFLAGDIGEARKSLEIAWNGSAEPGVVIGLKQIVRPENGAMVRAARQSAGEMDAELKVLEKDYYWTNPETLLEIPRATLLTRLTGLHFEAYTPRQRTGALALLRQTVEHLRQPGDPSRQALLVQNTAYILFAYRMIVRDSLKENERRQLDSIWGSVLTLTPHLGPVGEEELLQQLALDCIGQPSAPQFLLRILENPELQETLRTWWQKQPRESYEHMLYLLADAYGKESEDRLRDIFQRDPNMGRTLAHLAADWSRDNPGDNAPILVKIESLLNKRDIPNRPPLGLEEKKQILARAAALFENGYPSRALKRLSVLRDRGHLSARDYLTLGETGGAIELLENDELRSKAASMKDEIASFQRSWSLKDFGAPNSKATATLGDNLAGAYARFSRSPLQKSCAIRQLANAVAAMKNEPQALQQALRVLTGLWAALPSPQAEDVYPLLVDLRQKTGQTAPGDEAEVLFQLIKDCVTEKNADVLVRLLQDPRSPPMALARLEKEDRQDYLVAIDLLAVANAKAAEPDIQKLIRRQTRPWMLRFLDDVEIRIRYWRSRRPTYEGRAQFKGRMENIAAYLRPLTRQFAPALVSNTTYSHRLKAGKSFGILHDSPILIKVGTLQLTVRRAPNEQLIVREGDPGAFLAIPMDGKAHWLALGPNRVTIRLDANLWTIFRNEGPEPLDIHVPARTESRQIEILSRNLALLKTIGAPSTSAILQMNKDGELLLQHEKVQVDNQFIIKPDQVAAGDKFVRLVWNKHGNLNDRPILTCLIKKNSDIATESPVTFQGVHPNLKEAITLYNQGKEEVPPEVPGKGETGASMAMIAGTDAANRFDALKIDLYKALFNSDWSNYQRVRDAMKRIVREDVPLQEMDRFNQFLDHTVKAVTRLGADPKTMTRQEFHDAVTPVLRDVRRQLAHAFALDHKAVYWMGDWQSNFFLVWWARRKLRRQAARWMDEMIGGFHDGWMLAAGAVGQKILMTGLAVDCGKWAARNRVIKLHGDENGYAFDADGLLSMAPDPDEEAIAMAHYLIRIKDYRHAWNVLRFARDRSSRNPQVLGLSARAAAYLKDYKSALNLAYIALFLSEPKSQAWGILANVLYMSGDLEGALRASQEEIELDWRRSASYVFRAQVFLKRWKITQNPHDLAHAITNSLNETRVNPESASAFRFLSQLYEYQGEMNKAIEASEKEVDIQRSNRRARHHLYLLYQSQIQAMLATVETRGVAQDLLERAEGKLWNDHLKRLRKLFPAPTQPPVSDLRLEQAV